MSGPKNCDSYELMKTLSYLLIMSNFDSFIKTSCTVELIRRTKKKITAFRTSYMMPKIGNSD